MKARLVNFGEIEVEGKRYTHDVVIDGGKVRKRNKGPSKEFRKQFGHTPLSAGEEIPWEGQQLLLGTGAYGALPVMDEVLAEAKRRGIEVIAAPTAEVCQMLEKVKKGQAHAILHCTC
ncbi:MAG TPA: MTH938/NDUFAF3 family protein [Candidatus Udaeobacter sp.]|nr:MTH938/NDUFAF3 family protein [Candidatus Udaeobacter sp.]